MPLDAATDSTSRIGLREYVRTTGTKLFDRGNLLTLWQEMAENFYAERADFTTVRTQGDELARNLMSSYPLILRRDLGNSLSAMLRPSRTPWFKNRTNRPDREDTEARQWLDKATDLQYRAMYDRRASFIRAAREADHDYVTFGQAVIQTELYRPPDGTHPRMLYRCRHLRDMAWREDTTGQIDTIYRRDKPDALSVCRLWPKTVHRKVKEKVYTATNRDPYAEVNVWHCVIPSDLYRELPGGKDIKQPWVSVYYDMDNDQELECLGQWTRGYVIPRWQTVSGSQYAHSAAMVAALPDARLLQAISLVLLNVSEKAADPPLIAVDEHVRSDYALYAGGIIKVDADYDERMGEVLRPLAQDKTGLPFALELVRDLRLMLKDATFLAKLDMPPAGGPEMTAYEVGQRVQEYIRNALPLFEPIEVDYSAWLCEDTFELLFRNSPEMQQTLPRSLMGSERQFEFESPLRAASEKAKAGMLIEAGNIIANASQLDPTVALLPNMKVATRDVLHAVVPAGWLNTEKQVSEAIAEKAAQEQQAKLMAMMEQGAGIAKTASEAAGNVATALPQFGLA